ncbi:MAG: C-terminal target protein, partial [Bacteroidota bacterium]|nr:C-terminal target protein [Bacteroidota bacterium]
SATGKTITLNGSAQSVSGTTSTAFPNLQIGTSASSVTVTMNNNNTCSSLNFNANTFFRTLNLATGYTLAVSGDVTINQPTGAVTNTFGINGGVCSIAGNLNFVGASNTTTFVSKVSVTSGSLNLTGNVSWMSNTAVATEVIVVSTGTVNFGSPVTMGSGSGTLWASSTGTFNFNGTTGTSFIFGGATSPVFTTTAGCFLNFKNGFTNNSTALVFTALSTTTFTGNGAITPNAAITFGSVNINANDTLVNGGNIVKILGSITMLSGSAFWVNQSFEVSGNWTNNGGTLTALSDTITFSGPGQTISGTNAFSSLQIGNGLATTVGITLNNSSSCANLIISAAGSYRTLTISTGVTLSVSRDLTINQGTVANTNTLAINTGTCNVSGNLNFVGSTNTATFIAKLAVTTGTFTLGGTVNWMSNTAVATEVITVSTGTITFNSPVNMGQGSGTLSVTSTGIINFNGSSPSYTFGGIATSPVFTTTSGCTINFAHGFANNANAIVFNASSNIYFTGGGCITANAAITLGNVQINANDSLPATGSIVTFAGNLTLANGSVFNAQQNFQLGGNWINNGGAFTGVNDTIILTGSNKTIGSTVSTAFPVIQVGCSTSAGVSYTMNNSNSCNSILLYGGGAYNTFTLSPGYTFTVNGDVTINQPSAGLINTLAVAAGICNIGGNLSLPGTVSTSTFKSAVTVSSGSLTIAGNVNWGNNTTASVNAITVGTGTVTFNSAIVMASGTISVTGIGTVNFNGPSPSFTFGGSNSPKFGTANGCTINFLHGFINNSHSLTFAGSSNTNFNSTGSITPNASITFGKVTINSSDSLLTGAGNVIVANNFTLAGSSLFYAKQNFEVDGNFTNNSGTLAGTTFTVFMNGTAQLVTGSPITFQTLQIGNSNAAVNAAVTIGCNTNCSALTFQAGINRIMTLNSGTMLIVSGNLTIGQPTIDNNTALFEVGAGSCNVGGNLIFTGANSSSARIAKLDVTSGSFNLTGIVTWASNTNTADEVITVSSGTVTFNSSLTMASVSGTLKVTGAGIINFNGATAPSFKFGGTTAPVFSAVSGSTINIKNGITTNVTPLTFAVGSTQVFTGSGTITPNSALTFSTVQISSGKTITLAGSISVLANWVDSGTLVPSTYNVTFNGSDTQILNKSGGNETFYQLTLTPAGKIIRLFSDLLVTNTLNMGANIDLNSKTLTLGNGAGAILNYTSGIAYGGTWKRWFAASAISSSSGSYYGLFPIGSSTDYRYIAVNSTANPTSPGYVSATHTDTAGVTTENYTDNAGSLIQEIANIHSDIVTTGLTGGTYTLAVHFTGFSTAGNVAYLQLETYTGGTMGSCGTEVTALGPPQSPTAQRSALSATNLNNRWVISTTDIASTPLYAYYYSRKTGNWNDVTAGNGTWSVNGAGGPSCDCKPISGGDVIIESGNVVTVNTNDSIQFVEILNGGTLISNSSCTINVSGNLTATGTGTFTNNGTMTINGTMTLAHDSPVSSGNISVGSTFTIPAGCTFTQTAGTFTATGNLIDSGTINISAGATLNLNGTGTIISGTGVISAPSDTITITNNKSIAVGSILTFGTVIANTSLAIAAGTTISNTASVNLNGNLLGAASSSIWVNNAQSTLAVSGALLTTGVLDVSTSPNTVNYNGAGSQTVKSPLSSYYNLSSSNAGTKTMTAAVQVDNSFTLGGSVIFDESTYALTGSAGLNMSGTSELKLQRSVAGTYPELSGIYTLTGGTITINQTGDSALLNGREYYNLKLTGTTPYDISGISTIDNNLNTQNSATVSNNNGLTIGGVFTQSSSGASTLVDNITVSGIVISAGTLVDSGYTINITGAGGWIMNGGTYNATGQVVFGGSVGQSIGGSIPTTFCGLGINNIHHVTLNVSPAAPTVVTGNLNLLNGQLITNTSNILRMTDTAVVQDGSKLSYVSGPMVKTGAADFIFPIGKNRRGRVGISNLTSAATEVTAEFFSNPYSSLAPVASPLKVVSEVEYWVVTRAVTSDSLKMQLFWDNASTSGAYTCNALTVAHWTGGQWQEEAATLGSGSSCSAGASGSVQTTGYVTSFSPFTIGGHTSFALPVELLSFEAVAEGKTVETKWSTSIEINNAYFTVEKSVDGNEFTEVGRIDGAGNSTSLLNYSMVDNSPFTGLSYYRLRQTDFNGKFSLSNTVSVNIAGTSEPSVVMYPNPAHDQVSIRVSNMTAPLELSVFDIEGRQVMNKKITDSEQTITLPLIGMLTPGLYFVSGSNEQSRFTEKLIVR